MKKREREREKEKEIVVIFTKKKILLTFENNLFNLFHWVLILNHHFYMK